MAIVERGKLTTTPIKIILPIPKGTRQAIEDIDKLRALIKKQNARLKELGALAQQMKTLNKIIADLNPKINCPELHKEIDIHWCHSACFGRLCEPQYSCQDRVEILKTFFKIPI